MKRIVAMLLFPMLLILLAGRIHAELPGVSPLPGFFSTDGAVFDMVRHGDVLYVGGDFDNVGQAVGHAAPFDAVTGQLQPAFPKVTGGSVYAFEPDGAGGWFLGGEFTDIGGLPRAGIAHLLSDYSVDAAWNPGANGTVYALLLHNNVLYLGGAFTLTAGQNRQYLAALDPVTGAVTGWNPGADSYIHCLAAGGSAVYAGGSFTVIGGVPRAYLAEIDTA
ncbi:hypothetical protein JXA80_05550, partial [bacterium]|nr:hypothetical protein [candidate division CSSED10-310 bacterium]